MKTSFKRFSRRTVSMVLAVLMMVSVLGLGTLITVNAADVNKKSTGTSVGNTTYYITGNGSAGSWGTWKSLTKHPSGYYSYYYCANDSSFKVSTNQSYNNCFYSATYSFWGSTKIRTTSSYFNQSKDGLDNGTNNFWIKGGNYVVVWYPNTDLRENAAPLITAFSSLPSAPSYKLHYSTGSWSESNFSTSANPVTESSTWSTSVNLTGNGSYEFEIEKVFSDYPDRGTLYYGNSGTMAYNNCSNWSFTNANSSSHAWINTVTTGSYTFTINSTAWQDKTVSLSVSYPKYSVSATQDGHGAAPTVGTSSVSVGSSSTLTAGAANTGYQFKNWTVTEGTVKTGSYSGTNMTTSTTNPITIYPYGTATTVTLQANYEKQSYTVKKAETGASGTVTVGSTELDTTGKSIEYDTNYTVTVEAPSGYKVTEVSGVSGTTSGLDTDTVTITGVTISAATTVSVTYVVDGTCLITAKNTNSSGAVLDDESMTIGSNLTVYAEGNAYHSSGNFSVRSSNDSVASVSSATVTPNNTFTVNAKSVGSATITISCPADSKSTTFDVTVSKSDLAATFSSADHVYVLKGDNTQTMGYTATPTVSSVSYSSGNTSVATVNSSTGAVTPVSAGTATMTVSVTYANGGTDTATKDIKVQDPTLTVSSNTLALDYTSDTTKAGSDYKGTNTFTVTTNGNNPAYDPVTNITVTSLDTTVVTVNKSSITSTSAETVTATAKKVGTANIVVKYFINGTEVESLRKTVAVTVSAYDVNMTLYVQASNNQSGDKWTTAYFIPHSSTSTTNQVSGGTLMTKIGTVSNTKPVFALNITKKQYTDGFVIGQTAATRTGGKRNTVRIASSDPSNNLVTITDNGTYWYGGSTAQTAVTITKPVITAKGDEVLNAGITKTAGAPAVTGSVSSYKWTSGTTSVATISGTTATPTITAVSAGTSASTVRAFIPLANTGITFSSLETSSSAAYDYIASNEQSFTITVADVKHTVTVQPVSRDTSSGTYTANNSAASATSVSPAGGVSHNTTATVSATAEDGYVLTGYYTAANGGTQLTGSGNNQITVTGDVTVYARFEQKYELTFTSANGTISGTGYNSTTHKLTTYAGVKPSDLTVAVVAGYRIDWENSTNLAKYYNAPSTLVGSVTLTAREVANINSADKVDTAVTIAYEAITPRVNYTAHKTTDGSTYTAGDGSLSATYTTGGGGGGGGTASSYYLHYNNSGSEGPANYSTHVNMIQYNNKYYATMNNASGSMNVYFNINTLASSGGANSNSYLLYNQNYTTISEGGVTGFGISNHSNTDRCYAYAYNYSKIYIILDTNNKTLTATTVDPEVSLGGGGGASSGGVVSGGTIPYGADVTFTADDTYTSGGETYKFVGWYSTAQPANNETALETDTEYTVNDVIDDVAVYARYNKVYSVTLYNTYYETGTAPNIVFHYYSSPPNRVEIKDSNGDTRTTLIYKNGELGSGASAGADRGHDKTVGFDADEYYEGNSISVCVGDTIKLSYSALASSDTITAVNFNNLCEDGTTLRHYTVEGQDNIADHDVWDYDYTASHCLWADENYYTGADANTIHNADYEATVNNDNHTVQWTIKGDYHNVDLEIEQKKQITFKSKTGLAITSKNTDNFYSTNEAVSADGENKGLKVVVDTAAQTSNNCTYELGTPTYYEKESGKQIVTAVPSPLPEGKTAADYYVDDAFSISYNTTTHKFTGTMPNYDVVIDMNVTTKFDVKIGSWMLSDPINGGTAGFNKWNKVASVTGTISSGGSQSDTVYDKADNQRASVDPKTIVKGTTITYSSTFYTKDAGGNDVNYANEYLFVGWYKGTSSGPDMENGLISTEMQMSKGYAPKENLHVWAVGTRMMYIGGSFYINDGEQTYCRDDDDAHATWATNRQYMEWDPDRACYSYTFDTVDYSNAYHFRVYETASSANGESDATIWNRWASANNTKYDNTYNGTTHTLNYGRYYMGTKDDNSDGWDNCGWFSVNSTVTSGGYDAPVTVYFYPADGGIEVSATYKWKKAYVSSGMNGFDSSTGTQITSNNTSAAPNKTCTVAATPDTGTTVTASDTHWDPTNDYKNELNVREYLVKTKDGSIRVTKDVASGYQVDAFVIYYYDMKDDKGQSKVSSVRPQAGATANSYYADIQISENCYIYPVLSKTTADLTVQVNYKDLDKTKWGDLISLYAWDSSEPAKHLNGTFPGQLMIPSADGAYWTATIDSTNLDGITFANHFGGTWIDNQLQSQTVFSTYNTIDGANNKPVQTYDYREPKALLDTAPPKDSGDNTMISFTLKDGNYDLTSYNDVDSSGYGTVDNSFYSTFYEQSIDPDDYNFEYLTNRDGSKHVDLNGADVDGEPTASFYVICKANTDYLSGVNQSKTAITYPKAYTGNWSVDWFVYDAEGNYITSILSAAYADRVGDDDEGLTLIANEVKELGYAYENRSVAISYDYPYGYSSNSRYRYSGQWISTSTYEKIRMNVKIAMKTGEDADGETIVPYDTNEVSGVGTATATYTGTKPDTITSGSNGEYVEIRVSDAKNDPVEISATEQNFIGWYMYDEETEKWSLVKTDSEFNPNFNENSTYYAVYEAKATYRYKYLGREANESDGTYDKYYTVTSSLNLTAEEMANSNRPSKATVIDLEGTTRLAEAAALAPRPTDIAVFKKNVTVSINDSTTCTPSTYTLTFDCTTVPETYTLTYYYCQGANGANYSSATATGAYNEGIDIGQDIKTQVVQNAPSGKKFVGWYDAQTGGHLLSKQANFGMSITENTSVYAHYETSDYTDTYDATPKCEENVLSREKTGPNSGFYYNDFLCQFRKSDGTSQTASNCGILIIYELDTSSTFQGKTLTQGNYTTFLNAISRESGQARKSTAKNSVLMNITARELSVFSRVDLVFKSKYAEFKDREYMAVPYVYDGSSYTYGTPITDKTYTTTD